MGRISAKIIGTIIAPWWERRDGLAFRGHLRRLTASQYWEAERLHIHRRERLNRVLRHAYLQSPFYRQRLDDAGYSPKQEWDLADLPRLPVLEKNDIREHTEQLLAGNFDRQTLRRKRTGGSTSVPVHVYVDNEAFVHKTAATWRHNRWAGYDIGERLAMVWGATPPPKTLRGKIRRALYERSFALDTLVMTEENMQAFIEQCRSRKPGYMIGHAHSIYLLADFCASAGIEDVQFNSVITTAMVLLPSERAVIEQAFHTHVFNRYGCEELSIIASECEVHRGLHVHAEGLIAEVVNGTEPAKTGEFGDLVFTDLDNLAMPLIRYRIGDVGALAAELCSCGRTLPLLTEVRGRTADFLYTPEGNRVFGISILDTMMIHIPGIKQAQIVQDKPDELTIRLVVQRESFAADGEARLQRELPEYFGPRMRYRFEFVDKILPEKNGKYRFALCRLTENEKTALTRVGTPAPGEKGNNR